ncbi:MAG: aspartate--tRNA ligase [Gemmatimonadetes bacterium]|nr:aspartate--tRNA ligase [Gemmatimonadota bacterium]MBT8404195.1 aspartate--tRNA ligase [Gemmatimonadota bacterium]NNF39261.1 aspartate--tRNA ligase [Gemmatimonadota bacterium]
MTDPGSGSTALRSSYLGRLTAADVGRTLRLAGWVHRRRDLGGLLFLDLRDRSGLLQVSVGPDWTDETSLAAADALGNEDVVAVEGVVELRPDPNPELATGEVELRATCVERLNPAETPAIPVYRGPEDELPSEELRLRHRVLDLRRPELQENLVLRHRLILAVRNYMDRIGFVEVETPILTKPTPEGARDFVVPSSVHPGEFFALPQSPQIYKQILMVAGFDRYFQIARCFRDEALRADRQLEFTQIDVEASFVGVDDILHWMEGLMAELADVAGASAPVPFPRMTWDESMDRFGSDRPDLRWDLEISDWTTALGAIDFRVTQSAVAAGGRIRGFRFPGGARLSRKQIEAVEVSAKAAGAPGLLWAKRSEDGGSGPLSRFLDEAEWEALGAEVGDLFLVAAGDDGVTSPALDAVRAAAIQALDLPRAREDAWLWVTDFPVFEADGDGGLAPNHHPFVQPHDDALELLDGDPLAARGDAYDLVYNGTELGSGSIRIHDAALQRRIFRLLGLSDDEIEMKFGFLLTALAAGAPPHGGVAFGMDRIVQRFAGVSSLRDVIAFPKTTAARALFEGAPVRLGAAELDALGLALTARPDPDPDPESR